jgi:predicted RecA/RadA family phage recombinase
MKATYWQRGETIEYTNGGSTTIEAGDVVSLATRCGVAGMDIVAEGEGTLYLEGVYIMPKDSSDIAVGASVYFDESENKVSGTAAGNIPLGWAIAAAGTAATTCYVKIGENDINAPVAAVVAAVTATNGTAVATADATAAGAAYDQTVAQSAVALANANKAQINVLVALGNANKTALNAVITALKAAGLMSST